jgi:hypothetical protein
VWEVGRLFGANGVEGGGFSQSRHHRRPQENTLTRLFVSGRAIAAASALVAVVALAGCELVKRNEDVATTVSSRVIGIPVGTFFERYGRTGVAKEDLGNNTSFDWLSDVGMTPPGHEGRDDRICKLRLTVDKGGRISAVQILYDAQGTKSSSRCGEIFAAK